MGPEFRYRTDVYADRPADSDGAVASLLVVAAGDPTLSSRFHPTDLAPFDSLADSLRIAGVRRVTGELVVDASTFDRALVHPTWEVGDLEFRYAAPVAAFAVAEGTVRVVVAPAEAPGAGAKVELLGPAVFPVSARVVTDTAGATAEFRVRRSATGDTIRAEGKVPILAAAETVQVAVRDPVGYAATALAAALAARGIAVEGGTRVVYDTAEARALRAARAAATPAATWTSPPLREIVAAMLKPSQNWIAEQVLKTLAAERAGQGTWEDGIALERRYLTEAAGIDSGAFFLRDASGLSVQNLLTPHAIVQLLRHARSAPWGEHFRRALAEPGAEGTLKERLLALQGRLFAKTGTITHVNSLSGYVLARDGRELVFSFLTNGSGRPSAEVRRAIDRLLAAIAQRGGRR